MTNEINFNEQPNTKLFRLNVTGNAMAPHYQAGDEIVFRRQHVCKNGADCIVEYEGKYLFRTVFKNPWGSKGSVLLHCLEDGKQSKAVSSKGVKIIAVAIYKGRKIDARA